MTVKFTPGPWGLDAGDSGGFQITADDGRRVLAGRNPWEHRAVESWANGRLMQAAPDMYDALKEIADRALIDDRSIGDEAYDMLRELRALLSRIDGEGA